MQHQILYRDERFNAAFPSIVRIADDRLLLAFRRARSSRAMHGQKGIDLSGFATHLDPRSHIALLDLDGEGSPLGSPRIAPICPEAADQDPNLLRLRDGTIVLGSFAWNPMNAGGLELPGFGLRGPEGVGRLHAYYFALWGVNMRRSVDDGRRFDGPSYLPELWRAGDAPRGSHGGAMRGRMVQGPGELYAATYLCAPQPGAAKGPQLFVSKNGGISWQWRSSIVVPHEGEYLAEPSLVRVGDRLWALIRSFRSDDATVVCWSDDDGRSWSEPVVSELIGHPVDPLPLADGRVLLSYGYRQPDYGIRCRIWDGRDPSLAGPERRLRDDGRNPDLGYPWAVQLADGSLLVTYYFHDDDGVRYIASTRFEP